MRSRAAPAMGMPKTAAKNAEERTYRSICYVRRILTSDNATLNVRSRQVSRQSPAIAYPTGCRYSTVPTPEMWQSVENCASNRAPTQPAAFCEAGRLGASVALTARCVDVAVFG
jgi:hypothetical protein